MPENNEKNAPLRPGGDAVLAMDRSLRIMGANQAALKTLGPELKPGRVFRVENFFQGPSAARAQALLDQALTAGKPSGPRQGRLAAPGRPDFPAEYGITPLFGPSRQITGAIITFRDLDYSPLNEDYSDYHEKMPHVPRLGYQALVEGLAEGVFTINTQWRITSFNQTAEKITGYRREEVLGRFCWDIFRSHLCQAGCPLKSTLETGLTRMDQDVRMLSKQGKHISVLCSTSVVRDKDGRVAGAVESFRPIAGMEGSALGASGRGRSFPEIIGASPELTRLFDMLPDVAASEASVVLTGESGTGKELFARAIHQRSPRAQGPFMAVNCSALAETLLESELFGHEKAAFTGAVRSRVGRFELAAGGTLFFDEIGDLKPELQIKLLRVLEERVFERVGGNRMISLDARIIAATNRDLGQAIREGTFREDLYYRLRTVPMDIPPLRRRRGDIPLLVSHFIKRFNRVYNKEVRSVDPKVMKLFAEYSWPGNVRELERVLEHAFVFVKGPVIFPANLPELGEPPSPAEQAMAVAAPAGEGDQEMRQAILDALRECGGKKSKAAELLGISRTSLWRRMKSLGLG